MMHDLQSSTSSSSDSDEQGIPDPSPPEPCSSVSATDPHSSPSVPPAPSPPSPALSPEPQVHQPQEPWFPFLSKPHMQLCLLYHGSHRYVWYKLCCTDSNYVFILRKNIDQITFQCIMDIMKDYIREEDGYFPKFDEVVNFKFGFWEEKLYQKVTIT